MVDTAIFLGAGASKAEGAPLQGQLFLEYFSSPSFRTSRRKMDRELTAFFSQMFGINVKRRDLSSVPFPTFEEVLGLTDLAIIRKEAFRHFDVESRDHNSGRLRFIAQYLVFLVADVLRAKLAGQARLHRELVTALREENQLNRTVFVSTNYDILIDNALTETRRHGIYLDYGVEFRNFEWRNDWERPVRGSSVSLFKPHGSLNWLFCPTCDELQITPKEKIDISQLISESANARCPECRTIYSPLIMPPTFYKDLNNVFLSEIWNRTDVALRKVKHIIFCGYSFPDADIHIKYLLKRAQTNRTVPVCFTVINNHPGKKPDDAQQEQSRYTRFLGKNVNYTSKSFEEFAADPLPFLRPTG